MLEGLLPRLLPSDLSVRYIVFEGKSDLEAQIARRLQHYRTPNARFVILRDKDAADCRIIKEGLVTKCHQAGRNNVLVRIACHELESWYLADMAAVGRALEINTLAGQQGRSRYRDPDTLANPVQELTRLTGKRYQKVGGSRAIGLHLNPDNQRSRSFAVFVEGVKRIAADLLGN